MNLLKDVATQVLSPEECYSLSFEGFTTTDDFLKGFERFKHQNSNCVAPQIIIKFKQAVLDLLLYKRVHSADSYVATESQPCPVFESGQIRIVTGEVVEVFGKAGCGKTQLSLHLTSSCVRQNYSVLYINSNNDFTASRLLEILQKHDPQQHNIEEMMKRVHVVNLYSAEELLDVLYKLEHELQLAMSTSYFSTVKLVIIDSITLLLGFALGSKTVSTNRLFSLVGQLLRRISNQLGISILVVNNTVGGNSDGLVKPALGFYWNKQCHKKLWLKSYNENDPMLYQSEYII